MEYKNLNKFLIFIILSLLVNGVVNGQQFIPGPRMGHTATLLGDLGKNLSWIDLNSQGVKFPHIDGHTSDIGGANQDSIFIIGGRQLETTNLVYRFNTKTNAIAAPVIQGKEPPRRQYMRSVSYAGKIYIFSGNTFDSINNNSVFFNNFDVLDTVTMNWQVGSLVNAPPPRFLYTATLVNGVIYYIGGLQQNGTVQHVSMANIYQYDIIGDTWSLKIATALGVMPGSRAGHSAVLVDNKICIYGGVFGSEKVPSTNQIAMLDTTTLAWSIPILKNPNIPNLVFHTATLVYKSMLLAFGNITVASVGGVINNNFYLFNLGDPIVTFSSCTARGLAPPSSNPQTPRTPRTSPTTTSSTDLPTNSLTGVVVGLSVGLVVVGLAAVGLVGIVIYRYRKKMKDENIPATVIQVPSNGDIHYPTYQQSSPQFARYSNSLDPHSRTSTLIQSQGDYLNQEFPTLPLPLHQRSSNNCFPGSEPLPSNDSSGSETPPPPPPKISQSALNIHGTNHQPYYK